MKSLCQLALVATLALAVGATETAQARQPGGGRGGGEIRAYVPDPTYLLARKSVQGELKLSEKQIKKVEELAAKRDEIRRAFRDLYQNERMKKTEELTAANQKAVADILKPEQAKRLKQITLQQRGAYALYDPEVASALKLTDEQKRKLRDIPIKAFEEFRGRERDRSEEMRKKREELYKSIKEKQMGVLTDEQKAKLKELAGEPFKDESKRSQK